ncbi:hypothetical protein GALMADRAFT_717936 [Galerina marginata CBS 339.88]|uniref:Uncharacterized protein n=1 Tax=Galerina marginata (strain CBS 339.88) TaxID=685588 RepID=A0A067TN45_GALM3|nr:hypothetical protein GALMADRAFT_717936 [Galerina marginata CBS 339.88]
MSHPRSWFKLQASNSRLSSRRLRPAASTPNSYDSALHPGLHQHQPRRVCAYTLLIPEYRSISLFGRTATATRALCCCFWGWCCSSWKEWLWLGRDEETRIWTRFSRTPAKYGYGHVDRQGSSTCLSTRIKPLITFETWRQGLPIIANKDRQFNDVSDGMFLPCVMYSRTWLYAPYPPPFERRRRFIFTSNRPSVLPRHSWR